MPTRLTIGRLAQAAGVGIETVRFYQRSHLLTEPERPASGYREYSQADVERIRFIKRAQTLGFSLEDIRGLLELDGPQTCKQAHDLALNNLHLVEEKIASLGLIRKALRELIHKCELKQDRGDCPIIQSLARSKSESSYC
jgi:MerR family mercuric resistance operon transcriptional regulator